MLTFLRVIAGGVCVLWGIWWLWLAARGAARFLKDWYREG